MIEQVEFEGVVYPVTVTKSTKGEKIVMRHAITIDETVYKTTVEYTEQMRDDLRLVCGLDAETELKNIILHELKHEIFQKVYGETIKEQIDKVTSLIGKSDDDLQALIDNDPVFAVYMRNFQAGVTTNV
jgi:hypothetical protein